MNTLLETRALKTHFRLAHGKTLHAVDGVSLAIAPGEMLGLAGESGSGKSTLGRTIMGLLPKTAGTVLYAGEALPQRYSARDFRRYAREMAMIFQDPHSSLNPRMTVAEIVAEPLRLLGMASRSEQQEQVEYWLQCVGLNAAHGSRYAHEFSGGQRQRIGIARALIAGPRLLICDEPVSALDVSVQAQIVNLLARLRRELGLGMLFISHDLALVRQLVDRVAIMYLGAIMEQGPVDQVFADPRHPYTRLLLAASPTLDPQVERQRKHVPIRGEIGSAIDLGPGCRFAARCPLAQPDCRQRSPQPRSIAPGHILSCHID